MNWSWVLVEQEQRGKKIKNKKKNLKMQFSRGY